jgi:hypothetical protein
MFLVPWHGSHLIIDSIDPWTIRLDGRLAASASPAGEAATGSVKS